MKEEYKVYTNQQSFDDVGPVVINPTEKEIARLRNLAERYAKIAASDDMKTKKRQWKALRDLKPERPMILFETFSVNGFLKDDEIECENQYLRNAETNFLYALKQYEYVKDDIVFEPYLRLAWRVIRSDYGVKIIEHHAEGSLGYMSNFPIKTPEDFDKLKERDFYVDKERTLCVKEALEKIFGDILPIVVGNYDNWFSDIGYTPFCGNNAPVTTMDLFKLVGNDNMLFWVFDEPEMIHKMMRFLTDDRLRFIKWLKQEGVTSLNTDNQFAGPSGYGYVSDLPEAGSIPDEKVTYKDCWTWCESQETNLFSPEQFNEFFLPYLADYCKNFGLTSYGCCEPVDDRIEYVKKAIPNLRTVSVSGWNNFEKVADALGRDYVYCRKPNPTFVGGKTADWDGAKNDVQRTWNCTKDKVVEFIVRDVYDVNGEIDRIPKWVEMTKKIIGI